MTRETKAHELPFSAAFEISEMDIVQAAKNLLGMEIEIDAAEGLVAKLDADRIAKAALHGDDLDSQTDYAYEEIAEQLKGLGYGPSAPGA